MSKPRPDEPLPSPGRAAEDGLSLTVITPVYNEAPVVEASLRRVLALSHPLVVSLQLVAVDDGSTDGSLQVLQRLAAADDRVVVLRHARNRGKGAAVRTAIPHATGDVTVIHDADLEYDPADLPALMRPFVEASADAVFGARDLLDRRRRAVFGHALANRALTCLSNRLAGLALRDLNTCYKMVRTPLLRSLDLRADDFRFDVELAFELARRGVAIREVPIRYVPRARSQGKKIRARDGALAVVEMLRRRFGRVPPA